VKDFPIQPIAWVGRGPATISTFEPEPEPAFEIITLGSTA
jgi:hypothetical protein